jgi:hypothetical protein
VRWRNGCESSSVEVGFGFEEGGDGNCGTSICGDDAEGLGEVSCLGAGGETRRSVASGE